MGSQITFDFDPGAYAPGFMLPPASQAKPHFLCKAPFRKKVDGLETIEAGFPEVGLKVGEYSTTRV